LNDHSLLLPVLLPIESLSFLYEIELPLDSRRRPRGVEVAVLGEPENAACPIPNPESGRGRRTERGLVGVDSERGRLAIWAVSSRGDTVTEDERRCNSLNRLGVGGTAGSVTPTFEMSW